MNQSRENRDICGENLSSRTEDYRGHCGVSFFPFFFVHKHYSHFFRFFPCVNTLL